MPPGPFLAWCVAALCAGPVAQHAGDGASIPSIELVVPAARPLEVRLDVQVTVHGVGQPIVATVIEPVYAYDRIVVPTGSKAYGRVIRLEGRSRLARAGDMLGGHFSPNHHVVLQFDTLELPDGRRIPIRTSVERGTEHLMLQHATPTGAVARAQAAAAAEIKQKEHEAAAVLKAPDKKTLVKEELENRLPYHPDYLRRGTVYDANLLAPLDFGPVVPTASETMGALPPPDSIVHVRLVTPLDSGTSKRGAPVEAVVTQPVFSAQHHLILPEGTVVTGEVTSATPAHRFHRNGQLRFLFEHVNAPAAAAPETMLASLHAAEVSATDHVAIDEEGGASIPNSNTRFIAPALAYVAMRASGDHDGYDADRVAHSATTAPATSVGGQALGGFSGFGLLGIPLGMVSRPLATAFGFYGFAETAYVSLIGKGNEVKFPGGTRMELQLAPGPASK